MVENVNATTKKKLLALNEALTAANDTIADLNAKMVDLEKQVLEYHLLKKKFIENK